MKFYQVFTKLEFLPHSLRKFLEEELGSRPDPTTDLTCDCRQIADPDMTLSMKYAQPEVCIAAPPVWRQCIPLK